MVVVAGGQAPHPFEAAAYGCGVLKSAADGNYIPQEAKGVQQVRFSGGVRADHEEAIPYCGFYRLEVAPVHQCEMFYPHRGSPSGRASDGMIGQRPVIWLFKPSQVER